MSQYIAKLCCLEAVYSKTERCNKCADKKNLHSYNLSKADEYVLEFLIKLSTWTETSRTQISRVAKRKLAFFKYTVTCDTLNNVCNGLCEEVLQQTVETRPISFRSTIKRDRLLTSEKPVLLKSVLSGSRSPAPPDSHAHFEDSESSTMTVLPIPQTHRPC